MNESNFIKENIAKEVSILHSKKILHPNDSVKKVLLNHGETKEWADGFWRRRDRHKQRPDPEIEFVFETNPKTVLEIGAAYGRILKKLSQEGQRRNLSTQLFGIEQCQYMIPYFQEFKERNSSLSEVVIFFENFFNSDQLKKRKFDVILLPMNTFPSFYSNLELLFKTVKNFLSEDGIFIFTTYKTPKDRTKEELLKESYSGELLLGEGEKPITLEVFRFSGMEGEYGIESVSYLIYYRFSEYYRSYEKFIYRLKHFVPQKDHVEKIIERNGFKIELFDDKSHSLIFGCKVDK